MHNGYMHDGWGGGSWGWIVMAALMVVFWGGLIWLGVTLIRRTGHTPHPQATAPTSPGAPAAPPPAVRPSPQEVLADRLARGDIDPDDYRQRLDALRHVPGE
jgi:putative membrane protein